MGSKEWFLIMSEENFNSLELEQRALFSHVELREANEWSDNRNDENYVKLKKAERKAKKDVQEYLFNKRNKL